MTKKKIGWTITVTDPELNQVLPPIKIRLNNRPGLTGDCTNGKMYFHPWDFQFPEYNEEAKAWWAGFVAAKKPLTLTLIGGREDETPWETYVCTNALVTALRADEDFGPELRVNFDECIHSGDCPFLKKPLRIAGEEWV